MTCNHRDGVLAKASQWVFLTGLRVIAQKCVAVRHGSCLLRKVDRVEYLVPGFLQIIQEGQMQLVQAGRNQLGFGRDKEPFRESGMVLPQQIGEGLDIRPLRYLSGLELKDILHHHPAEDLVS